MCCIYQYSQRYYIQEPYCVFCQTELYQIYAAHAYIYINIQTHIHAAIRLFSALEYIHASKTYSDTYFVRWYCCCLVAILICGNSWYFFSAFLFFWSQTVRFFMVRVSRGFGLYAFATVYVFEKKKMVKSRLKKMFLPAFFALNLEN